jgi:hypothetical protein
MTDSGERAAFSIMPDGAWILTKLFTMSSPDERPVVAKNINNMWIPSLPEEETAKFTVTAEGTPKNLLRVIFTENLDLVNDLTLIDEDFTVTRAIKGAVTKISDTEYTIAVSEIVRGAVSVAVTISHAAISPRPVSALV